MMLLKRKYKDQIYTYFRPLTGHYHQIGNKSDNLPMNKLHSDYLQNQDPKNPLKFKVTNSLDKIEYYLIDEEMKRDFLVNKQDYYTRIKTFATLDILYYKGLVFQEGQEHRLHRKILTSFFHFQNLEQNLSMIQQSGQELIQRIQDFNKDSLKKDIEVFKQFSQYTGDVVSAVFLGDQFMKKQIAGQSVPYYVISITGEMMNLCVNNMFVNIRGMILGHQDHKRTPEYLKPKEEKQITAKCQYLKNVIMEEFQKRIKSYEQDTKQRKYNDLLAVYLKEYLSPQNQKLSDSDPMKITIEIIFQQYTNFIFAGTDTTAILLTTAMFFLSKYPEIQEKLRKECQENVPDINNIQLSQIKQLKTVDAFFNECLRNQTIVGQLTLKVATQDHKLGDLEVKKGDYVNVGIHGYHNNPFVFKDPYKFDISRWENNQENNLSPFDFMPFSTGSKNCIGQHLARLEGKVAIVYLLRNFKIDFKDGDQELVMFLPQLNQLRDDKIFKFTPL